MVMPLITLDMALVRRMLDAGHSQRQIADACGCSYETVRKHLKARGLATRYVRLHRNVIERQKASRGRPHYEPTEAKHERALPAAWATVHFVDVHPARLEAETRRPGWHGLPSREVVTHRGYGGTYSTMALDL